MAATAEKKEKPVSEKLQRVPKLGEFLLWYPHAQKNQTPGVGLVVESMNGCCRLLVYGRNSVTPSSKDGVRHVDDPYLKEHYEVAINSGGWDWTDRDKEINATLELLESAIK